jgi:hypothetical protein
MKIDDEFYRFPYGNVNGSDGVCLGGMNLSAFKNPEEIFFNWITTVFNFDYTMNIKANKFYKKSNVTNHDELIPITYDLEYINLMLSLGRGKDINPIDAMFFLSHIDEVKNLDFTNIFFKHPGIPEKIEI